MIRSSMIHALGAAFALALLGCGTAAGVCGCAEQQCEPKFQCEEEPVPELVCEAPATGPAKNECGIFVSSSLGDDANPGTREQPVRTMTQALALARLGPTRVYACAELFPEAVTAPSGLEIWGGLD